MLSLIRASLLLALTSTLAVAQLRESDCTRSLKSPIPSGARCGTAGAVSSPQLFKAANMLLDGLPNCIDECMDDVACLSFSYNSVTGRCNLYKAALGTMGFAAGTNNNRFYERVCYKQDCETTVKRFPTGSSAYDDEALLINLPFPIQMYGKTTSSVYMSVNGVLSFTQPTNGLSQPQQLPAYQKLPDVSVCVFWQDAQIQASADRAPFVDQELRWEYRNDFERRTVRFFWRVQYPYASPTNHLEAELWWYEGQPGPAFIFYTAVGSDRGSAARIGSECASCGKFNEFPGQIDPGLTLGFRASDGVWYNPLA